MKPITYKGEPQEELNVAIIQMSLEHLNPAENAHVIDILLKDLEPIEDDPIDLIVLPEMWNTGYVTGDEKIEPEWFYESLEWMKQKAQHYNTAIFGSMIHIENDVRTNRGVWVYPNGETLYYDKMHLFGPGGEAKHFSSGSERLLVEYKGWKLFPIICYDLRFPVWCRWTKKHDYDAIVCVASWPQARRSPWKALLRARASENLCYVLACNRVGVDSYRQVYSGDSRIIDPKLSLVKKLNKGEIGILLGRIDKRQVSDLRKKFPALEDADEFTLHF
ncbi:nitrilase-related carbon-nitrogen hydrolase [Porphyromonas canoris]|uniref:CN hydrolase domain-containing protein n=1 Tax=Porphyromonas canoris TaxID=36875 RepID=A0ABR4XLW3_9PORP|nr:nitrilase-related carbon-nitrogen hydrolase [Porphyromonas canoris]KGN92965.1 hypothetical protein HQ43_03590 [Porphyromonas canoris]